MRLGIVGRDRFIWFRIGAIGGMFMDEIFNIRIS
jgi:hypothetical protein